MSLTKRIRKLHALMENATRWRETRGRCRLRMERVTYWDTICVFLSDTLSLRLALLKRVLVLELGTHFDSQVRCVCMVQNYKRRLRVLVSCS